MTNSCYRSYIKCLLLENHEGNLNEIESISGYAILRHVLLYYSNRVISVTMSVNQWLLLVSLIRIEVNV